MNNGKLRFLYSSLSLVLLFLLTQFAASDEKPQMTEITPMTLVFSTSGGNVVASVGPDGVLLVGSPSASSTAPISDVLGRRTKSAFRYVVIFPQDSSRSEGDAGWQKRGAFVAMQENALQRLGGGGMGNPKPLPATLAQLGVERPRVAFSEVLKFDINGDAVHIVHQKPGYSDADAIAHFHKANLVYLGEVFPGDGYPEIDAAHGGTLDGLLNTINPWAGGTWRVVPARGNVVDGNALKEYRDMIVAVRDHVYAMVKVCKSEEEIIAAHPTATFDERWGQGRIAPEDFVREVYAAVKSTSGSDGKKQ